jgi:gas vesicle protein
MSENREDGGGAWSFMAGLGLGALIGAALGVLVAPKPGTETREELKTTYGDLAVKATKLSQELTESSQELIKKSKELIETTRTKVQDAVDEGKQVMAKQTEQAEQLDQDTETIE